MDDKWDHAIGQYLDQPRGMKPDPVPLATLFRAGEPPPPEVLDFLAEQINPTLPRHIRGNWALRVRWTGKLDKFWRKAVRNIMIADGKIGVGERHALRVRAERKRGWEILTKRGLT
jgi:hypothetical protein